ncbi:MAG: adenosylcobinamide amidohydrolase [Acidimicrobiales bacterium]|nr:adenosylcobinamide amidohydrolase [Acidimicrobiales bacterium]
MRLGAQLHRRVEAGRELWALAWRPPHPLRVASTSLVGGGVGERSWFLNAQVAADYGRVDGAEYLRRLASGCGVDEGGETGVGMLTAVDVRAARRAADGGVEVVATVGLGWPTWAAAPPDADPGVGGPGTVNVWVVVPAALSDAALVNAVATATEAKVQALHEAGVAGTGTASDAVAVAAPTVGEADPFGGPRSAWGACLARAVHTAVLDGARADAAAARAAGHHR